MSYATGLLAPGGLSFLLGVSEDLGSVNLAAANPFREATTF